jgi:hypothetical protein
MAEKVERKARAEAAKASEAAKGGKGAKTGKGKAAAAPQVPRVPARLRERYRREIFIRATTYKSIFVTGMNINWCHFH